MMHAAVVIDVATLLCVLVKYAVAKLHILYLNVFRQSIGVRATIKTCLFCVYLREPGDTYNTALVNIKTYCCFGRTIFRLADLTMYPFPYDVVVKSRLITAARLLW